nr:aminotransferase class I/II-fold pyridoxal phosphate-dependent enzyme [Sphingomonas sp. BT553]
MTFHGGRVDEAALRYPDAPMPWIDLSTGINPFAWQTAALPEIDWRALPSVSALRALTDAAAAAFDAPDIAIAAVPGSEIALRSLAHLSLPEPFHVIAPSYRTHLAALPGARAIDRDAVLRGGVIDGTLLLANPNNPDGEMIAPDTLLRLARDLAARGGVVVIDEAFADAMPGGSVLPLLTADDRVLVLRSFGKFFGLAGLRLGFVCGAVDLVAAVAERMGSWPVSSAAIAWGTAAYRDRAWIDATRVRLAGKSAALDRVLRGHGLTPRGECPLFRLVQTGTAGAIFERLARAGILTRPFDYAPDWLRIGLPDGPDALARLDEALRHR